MMVDKIEEQIRNILKNKDQVREVTGVVVDAVNELRRPIGETTDLRIVAAVCAVVDVNAHLRNGTWIFTSPKLSSKRDFVLLAQDVQRAVRVAEAALYASGWYRHKPD